ncbi:LytR C-terminal domain-containing protein [Paenibacillus sp. TRM 82003]|uniref:LytR C-terminal domain-containing protein n=1 Tax=Kineococcus sp. TRM81007 TaxID=2925831 RepID=UPI001F59C8B7|nr:LytR C-terminal domain-containing protein [Kineococcus sp. TRM81007]MCI2239502.1 LytR C-terminal domain-containing protein [Kineococcus sp. TRM81007]MCI3919303.1 LytR C-terminal domain-containing protein [Paenibacillus sp. TRM 82003]
MDDEHDGVQPDDDAVLGGAPADDSADDLDEASYERLHRRRVRRRRRQRAVFAVLVVLVLAVGGAAALVWTGRWQPGTDPVAAPASPTCDAAAEQPLTAPAEVSVEVLNGTDRNGLAAGVADQLRGRGFTVPDIGNAPVAAGPVTAVVRHAPDLLGQARAVAARFPEAQLLVDPAVTGVELTLGDAYEQLLPEDALAPPAPPAPEGAPPAC